MTGAIESHFVDHYRDVRTRLMGLGRVEDDPVVVVEPEPYPSLSFRMVLEESHPSRGHQILAEVCAKHLITVREVRSHRRHTKLVAARREACCRIWNETGLSYPQIGKIMNRDHTTVLHHVRNWRGEL